MPNPLTNLLTATQSGTTTGLKQADQSAPQDGAGFLEVLNLIGKAEQDASAMTEDLTAETEEVEIHADADPDAPEFDTELTPFVALPVSESARTSGPEKIKMADTEMDAVSATPQSTLTPKEKAESASILNATLSDRINQIAARPDTAVDAPQTPRPNGAELAQQAAILHRAGEVPLPDETLQNSDLPKPAPIPSMPQQPVAAAPALAAIATSAQPLQILASAAVDEPGLSEIDAQADPFGAPRDGSLPGSIRDLPNPAVPRPDTVRAIAGQLGAVITERPGGGSFQIALNPEELGRVSITMGGREDGLHVMIAAERPETLDLMRRHISVLADELQKLGLGDLTFDLGPSGGNDKNSDDSPEPPLFEAQTTEDAPETAPHPVPTGPERGLDLRL